jgi:hypothetical protein
MLCRRFRGTAVSDAQTVSRPVDIGARVVRTAGETLDRAAVGEGETGPGRQEFGPGEDRGGGDDQRDAQIVVPTSPNRSAMSW